MFWEDCDQNLNFGSVCDRFNQNSSLFDWICILKSVRFIRSIGILNIHNAARHRYQLSSGELGIAESVFSSSMTLIPLSDLNKWYRNLELATSEPDIILKMSRDIEIGRLGTISRWLLSGYDLASMIRRVNYGLSCLQSGAFLAGAQIGNLLKWTYSNPFIEPEQKAHDSVRVAIFMTKILREYLGESFNPLRVMLSGSRKNTKEYEAFFGCTVVWNHNKTEVWFNADLRLTTQQSKKISNKRLAMNFSDLDDFLNMPEPEDGLKVIYELINYSCHYSLPTVKGVAQLLGCSEQQFQRRLHQEGLNFTTVCGYVLSNRAIALMSKNVPLAEVAKALGYSNEASFNRMFKKQRGVTPRQYIERFHDVF